MTVCPPSGSPAMTTVPFAASVQPRHARSLQSLLRPWSFDMRRRKDIPIILPLPAKNQRAQRSPAKPLILFGGARRDRTADLYNAIVALSQLSYGPEQRWAASGRAAMIGRRQPMNRAPGFQAKK